jgi:hypothetical protein
MSKILKKYGMAAGWFLWSQANTKVAKASRSISSRAHAAPGGKGGGHVPPLLPAPPPLLPCCRLLCVLARGRLAGERGGEGPDMAGRLPSRLLGLLGVLAPPSLPLPECCCGCFWGGHVAPRLGATCSSNTRDMNRLLMAPCKTGHSRS